MARRKRYDVYIPELYWDRKAGSDAIHWHDSVLAHSRSEALELSLDVIKAVLVDLPVDVKFVSVFVGHRASPSSYAGRLSPIQVTRYGDRR